MDRDIIVIGAGPGGYYAAIRGAQLGAKVALIEKDSLGGTCLNRGCIPTKAFYREAEILDILKRGSEFGIDAGPVKIDIDRMQERKQNIVDRLGQGIEQLLKDSNIEIIRGSAVLNSSDTVIVDKDDGESIALQGKNIIIATGSKSGIPPIPGADLEGICTGEDILNFTTLPENLSIIGGGVVGMEMACIFNAMGTKVTVIEYMPSILSMFDSDITKRLIPLLRKRGIDIYASARVSLIEKSHDGYAVSYEDKKGCKSIEAEKVLISTGRAPAIDGLNLKGIGIKYDSRGIFVDDNFETNIKGVYAVGDVNGKVMLAHAASCQGMAASEIIMGHDISSNCSVIPSCAFIFPEIACVGITEEEAKKEGINYRTSKFMFGANGKALTLGESEGFVKVISGVDGTVYGKLLGAHIMGPHASDIIHEAALAISSGLDASKIGSTVHAHPTLCETFWEAVKGLSGESIHTAHK